MTRSGISAILWRWGSVAVAGDSMAPTYISGDWLMVRWGGSYKVGEAIVVEREDRPGVFLVKRLVRIDGQEYWVEGDNKSSSTDSRQWGAISREELVGKVVFRFRKARLVKPT